ncbi:MAG TPA: hypothetical protein VLK82_03100 [Candidatus Tectomicrobia bacterium]|nr:hypothetical protein [Candidatus Tectomicrobia bacterium]
MRHPFQADELIDLADGDAGKQVTLLTMPRGKRFVIECVGVNAFVQPGQRLFVAVHVTTGDAIGIYPIVPAGSSSIADPTFPARTFGSQQVRLYADPETNVDLSVARDDATAGARIFVSLSGMLIDSRMGSS